MTSIGPMVRNLPVGQDEPTDQTLHISDGDDISRVICGMPIGGGWTWTDNPAIYSGPICNDCRERSLLFGKSADDILGLVDAGRVRAETARTYLKSTGYLP